MCSALVTRVTANKKELTMYMIEDWAGNTMFDGKLFKSFEDGWAFICEHIVDVDHAYDDVSVVEVAS